MLTLFLLFVSPFLYHLEPIQQPLPEKGSITYHMRHKLHEWDGVSDKLKIQANWENASPVNKITKIAISTKVSSFNSGLSNRDSHMIEVLEALTYPNIVFNSTSIIYNQNDLLVTGQLQFHGVSKQISFNAKQSDKEGNIFFEGAFPILLEDFKVKRPSLLYVKAENEIQIKFKLYFK
jgi:polyisoprenoid-binding protein YceI